MRIAVIADIHGNLPALEAVLEQLEQIQPDQVIIDGDLINAVPFSPEVIDIVRVNDWIVVRGNHEFYYLDFDTERAVPGMRDPDRWGQLHWLVDRITPAQGQFLAVLPDERTIYYPGMAPMLVAHGVPGRNRVGFYNEQPEHAIVADIETIPQRTILSAHTHVQVDRHVHAERPAAQDVFADPHKSRQGRTIEPTHHWHVINPGSVGLPLNGDPGAQFAVIESVPESIEPGGWKATHYSIPYDRRPALEEFTSSGMLAAGGVVTQLFYWELVTANAEIILFMEWARENGHRPDEDMDAAFAAYCRQTGRDKHVRRLDPLYSPSAD